VVEAWEQKLLKICRHHLFSLLFDFLLVVYQLDYHIYLPTFQFNLLAYNPVQYPCKDPAHHPMPHFDLPFEVLTPFYLKMILEYI